MKRGLAIGVALVVATVGCSSHHASAPASATTAPAPATTTSTATAPNPDVIPSVITPAYVNAVLRVLDHIDGDATRALLLQKRVTDAVRRDVRAIYNDPLFSTEIEMAQTSLDGAIGNVRPDPGDRNTVVVALVSATSSCVFFSAKTNFSAVLIKPTEGAASEFFELAPKQLGDDPNGVNPTPWAFQLSEAFLTPTTVKSPCES